MSSVEILERGSVIVAKLARPHTGNALSSELIGELTEHVRAAGLDGARALVLTGSGTHFCAGADLEELAAGAGASLEDRVNDAAHLAALYAALLRSPLLTVAAVHGAAYGGGCGLAAACDLVLAGPDARFQFSEVRLGFVPALISVFLPRRVPSSRLNELFLDPRPLDAGAAVASGLADEACDDPLSRAHGRALDVARKASPSAVAVTKRLTLEQALPDLEARLAKAGRVNAEQRGHPECVRGVERFLAERRFPDWVDEPG